MILPRSLHVSVKELGQGPGQPTIRCEQRCHLPCGSGRILTKIPAQGPKEAEVLSLFS